MNLKAELKKIIELQKIDSQIYDLTQEKDKILPVKLEKVKTEFEEKKQTANSCEEKLKKIQLEKKDKEGELASKEENLRKSQGQLYQLKTNKEYQAKLTEIASLKADISLAEEGVLKSLDQLEFAKGELDKEKALLDQEEKKYKEEEQKIKNQIKDTEAKIINLQDKRKINVAEIDKQILAKYERLLKSRNGLAIAPVKNNNCSACFLNVTHQKVNEIKMYADLVFCENCVRILYIPEDLE